MKANLKAAFDSHGFQRMFTTTIPLQSPMQ